MWTHEGVWAAIDALARRNGLSPSALAKRSGLDPTSFNRSKRCGSDGRPRWPSTESIGKVLRATNTGVEEFVSLIGPPCAVPKTNPCAMSGAAPARAVAGLARAGSGSFFGDGDAPQDHAPDTPASQGRSGDLVPIEIHGDSMMPAYREGDIVYACPHTTVRRGDRVVVRTRDGEVLAKVLARQTEDTLLLQSINPEYPERLVPRRDVEWIMRILFVTQ